MLPKKLHFLGLNNNTVDWFKSSLWSDCEQVLTGNLSLSQRPVTVGVPHGNILRPLLLGIIKCSWSSWVSQVLQDHFVCINLWFYDSASLRRLESASLWLQSNLLTLNCFESKIFLFGSKCCVKSLGTGSVICINPSPLGEVSSFKFFVVTLTEDLFWGEHVKNIMRKKNQQLGLVRRINHRLP